MRLQNFRHLAVESQTFQSGEGEHDRIEIARLKFFEPRLHVSANGSDPVLAFFVRVENLRLPARRAGADGGGARQFVQLLTEAGDKSVAIVFALRRRSQTKAR